MVEKRTYRQSDFALGVTIPEIIEGDDLEIRQQSLQDGKNLRVTRGRSLRNRPGLERKVSVAADQTLHDMRVQSATGEQRFAVVIENGALQVWSESYELVTRFDGAPWGNFANGRPWVAQFENAMVFGGYGFWALEYDEGAWSFGQLAFADIPGGEKAIPYWVFERGVTLQPSDYTGAITLTASAPIFSSVWVGKRVRYARREVLITEIISPTVVNATVTVELPPTFKLTFANTAALSGYAVGQVVTASDTNWSGIITSISGTEMLTVTLLSTVEATSNSGVTATYGGPVTTDEIVGPHAAASPSAVARETTPQPTNVWDEQLWSDHRGWPRSGTAVNNRLAMCDFPNVPNLICISSARAFNDLESGSRDDDAIVRTAGNMNPRFRYIVNSTDLLIFADRGCYYVKTRDGEVLSPANFQVVQFDERGSDTVQPVVAEGAVLFVERNKGTIAACVLSGNVYLNWTVLDLTRFHAHLIRSPVAICGPAADPSMSERYIIVVNADGTMAAMSWFTTFGEERVGFFPWETAGRRVVRAFPIFDRYHAIVEKGGTFTLEVFNPAFLLDGAVAGGQALNASALTTDGGDAITTDAGEEIETLRPLMRHLGGLPVKVWHNRETVFTGTLAADGSFATPPVTTSDMQIGSLIDVRAKPWPQEFLESARLGMIKARVIRATIGVRETVQFKFRRNSTVSEAKARRPQDDPLQPPPLKTDTYRFNVFGNRAHPDMEVFLDEPNQLEITSITQEVQG